MKVAAMLRAFWLMPQGCGSSNRRMTFAAREPGASGLSSALQRALF